jgi:hypothetical protein
MSIADILKVLYGLYIHLWEKEGKQETTCEFLQDGGQPNSKQKERNTDIAVKVKQEEEENSTTDRQLYCKDREIERSGLGKLKQQRLHTGCHS